MSEMIWPVSDCADPVELVVIPNYHIGQDVGTVAVQTAAYFAWWSSSVPGSLRVNGPDGASGCEWLELCVDSAIRAEGMQDLLDEPDGDWEHDASFVGQTCHRGQQAEFRLVRSYRKGRMAAVFRFLPEAISYAMEFQLSEDVPYRLECCVVGSGTRATRDLVFDAQPQASGVYHHLPSQLCDHGNFWLTPSPFAYAFRQRDHTWSIAAVEAPVHELIFSRFYAQSRLEDRIEFVFAYKSLPLMRRTYRTPALVWRFGFSDELAAVEGHAKGMVAAGLVETPDRSFPEWWRGTMVCGWHRQVELAAGNLGMVSDASPEVGTILGATGLASSSDFANQQVYEDHVAAYEKADIPFEILTIDLGWSRRLGDWVADPDKWSDLSGFIRSQHEKKRKVLMWICSSTDGHTDKEKEGDMPNNPAWLARLERSMRYILGSEEGCLNADGLKFDFTAAKSVPGQQAFSGELHGYFHLYELYRVVSEAARRVKSEVLLDYQSAHPQFAHLHGMTRLNDFFLPQRQAVRVMSLRAGIARASTFGGMIDTDCPAGLEYLRNSWRLGNISLYLTHEQLKNPAIVGAIQSAQENFKRRS